MLLVSLVLAVGFSFLAVRVRMQAPVMQSGTIDAVTDRVPKADPVAQGGLLDQPPLVSEPMGVVPPSQQTVPVPAVASVATTPSGAGNLVTAKTTGPVSAFPAVLAPVKTSPSSTVFANAIPIPPNGASSIVPPKAASNTSPHSASVDATVVSALPVVAATPTTVTAAAATPAVAATQAAVVLPVSLSDKPIEAASSKALGIVKIDTRLVTLKSGGVIRPGELFPSGEKLIDADPASGRIVTDKRVVVVF